MVLVPDLCHRGKWSCEDMHKKGGSSEGPCNYMPQSVVERNYLSWSRLLLVEYNSTDGWVRANEAFPDITWATLTHWGRVTHICVVELTTIGSDNGLSPGRRQAIIWNNAGILLIGPLGTNFNEILIEIHTFSFNKMHLKMSSGKWQPCCLGLNVLIFCWFPSCLG